MSDESKARQRETMIAKHGSYDAWKAEMRRIAILGGKKSKRKLTHKEASAMGKLGGLEKERKRRENN